MRSCQWSLTAKFLREVTITCSELQGTRIDTIQAHIIKPDRLGSAVIRPTC